MTAPLRTPPVRTTAGAALLLAASGVGALGTAAAQPSPRTRPTIGADSARAVALRAVPGAAVRSSELERERGRLIYSLDLKVAGRPGVEEVAVDAHTGRVVARAHETPAQERREAARDSARAARALRAPRPRR